MLIIAAFYTVVFIGLFFAAQAIVQRGDARRPLPRVTQRRPPPLPGAYAEDVRIRIPSSRTRRTRGAVAVRQGEAGERRFLLCEGDCVGLTHHEDAGDGTATCPGCGTPRSTELDDGA